jgi:hypothetical protein
MIIGVEKQRTQNKVCSSDTSSTTDLTVKTPELNLSLCSEKPVSRHQGCDMASLVTKLIIFMLFLKTWH